MCWTHWFHQRQMLSDSFLGSIVLLMTEELWWGSNHVLYRCTTKIKPTNIEYIFLILADAKYYFIYHIDMYQGNNAANIDIHPSLQILHATHKTVSNTTINSVITNDPYGSWHIYMGSQYDSPQLFTLMESIYNMRLVGSCRYNTKVSDSERLLLD